jgi:hypothetical protein
VHENDAIARGQDAAVLATNIWFFNQLPAKFQPPQ